MPRFSLPPLLRAAAIAVAATAVQACATTPPRRVAPPLVASACTSTRPASVTWAVDRGERRTVRVGLAVLDDASHAWRDAGRARLEGALATWNAAGLPIRLARTADVSDAEVQVVVMRRLPVDPDDPNNAYRAGVTHLKHVAGGEIASAQVLIAEETPRGARYSSVDQEATLLHELGHALGLGHLDDSRALMSPRSTAVRLTAADVAMARSGYASVGCGRASIETASRPE